MEEYRVWIVCGVIFMLLCVRFLVKNRIIRWIAKSGLCSSLMVGVNMLVPVYAVAVNLYTIGVATLLGVPGVMTMYIVKAMIKM